MKPIRNEDQYEQVLARISELLDSESGSPEADELEVLSILVEAYEDKAHPVMPPHPLDAIRFAMEQRGLSPADLEECLGSSGRVSEVMNAKRRLSIGMIRKLHRGMGIPAEVLIQDYEWSGS